MRSLIITLSLFSVLRPGMAADEPITLSERFTRGVEYRVTTRVDLKGELAIPAEKDKPPQLARMTGHSSIDYDERVLSADPQTSEQKSIRQYRKIDFERQVADKQQAISLRPEVKRLVVIKRERNKLIFSPDGALTWGEIDTLRTDIFVPALAGMLPDRAVKPGESWRVGAAAVAELTDMEKVERGELVAKFETIEMIGGRKTAHITLAGDLEGVNEDGPNRQKLSGKLYFDLEGEFINYLSINGEHYLLDKDGRANGKVTGEFVMLRRQGSRCPTLADAALTKLELDPNADNTQLLFIEPELGVRMLHPRRWRVGRVARSQITLDEAGGSGLLITVEPLNRLPTAQAYSFEARGFLEKQKAKVIRIGQPARLQAAPAELDQFTFDAEVGGQRVVMDYLLARQANAGATFAARIVETDRDALMKQVERMARSLTLSRRLEGK